MSTDAPQVPQISDAKRKRLAAQAFNNSLNEEKKMTCPKCNGEILLKPHDGEVTPRGRKIHCPKCGRNLMLTHWVRRA